MENQRNQIHAFDDDEDLSEELEDGGDCKNEGSFIQEPAHEALFSTNFEQPRELNVKIQNSQLTKYSDFVENLDFHGQMNQGPDLESPKILKTKRRKAGNFEIHGSSIFQSSGRKDGHSKVCTGRGNRDRRIRLSPKTAIDFYDVQDRLGYDRPSIAIDWLMQEAKAAIDALDYQPPHRHSTGKILKYKHLSDDRVISNFYVNRALEGSFYYSNNPSQILETNFFGKEGLFTWNCSEENSGIAGGETGQFISSLPHCFPSYNEMFSQREPLQSSVINYASISTCGKFPGMGYGANPCFTNENE